MKQYRESIVVRIGFAISLATIFLSLNSCRVFYRSGLVKSHNISYYYIVNLKEYRMVVMQPYFCLISIQATNDGICSVERKNVEYKGANGVIEMADRKLRFSSGVVDGFLELHNKTIPFSPSGLVVVLESNTTASKLCCDDKEFKKALNIYVSNQGDYEERALHSIISDLLRDDKNWCPCPDSLPDLENP